ncbi:rod shape-determining protein RodA [Candidatus Saccharibacteria bacterium]|nr:rod shape-determining protein RodA [Candidatus Saccharibacteria bacterium]NIV04385.1 rod shape-determining protein RodA [Calditrichia bacterium]NIS38938.1 rod shape-determining protein RodA [Candidatus Saccharibacteria bacterium]NIV72918.1 rod shape-determining protein RodA [Calditrichia bacterium]NIW00153.1 rod shape-determining protein RodA [Candidatus Saccharibacteria bacterium]
MLGRLKNFDWILFFSVLFLAFIGLAAIYSVALSQQDLEFFNFKKQLASLVVGVFFIFAIALSNYRLFKNYRRVIYIIGLLLLLGVLFFGETIRGTTGWYAIGPINFQPAELAKICLLILMASYLSERSGIHFGFKQLVSISLLGGAYVILVMAQPDLGSAMVLFSLWIGLLFLASVHKKYIALILIAIVLIGVFGWFFVLQDYQKERVLTFIDPGRDPLGQGYNVTQAVIAVGSGGLFGRGLGFGSQSQLKFLPESQTDFIFAVVAEELGLIGVGLIFILFGLVFWRLIKISRRVGDDFSMFLVLGIIIYIFVQFGVNVAMNLGWFPVTGITLPFLSYGASSLLIFLILVGIAESVAVHVAPGESYHRGDAIN